MEHRFWALGSFDESFESYIDRTNEFRRSNGKPSVIVERQRPPADFAGIAFGYMQLPNEGSEERYVAVGAQCDTIDVRCHSPLLIDMTRHARGIRKFAPRVHEIDDACASALLADLAVRNPLKFALLRDIAGRFGWAGADPWTMGRARALSL
jgi:hypothetical protein